MSMLKDECDQFCEPSIDMLHNKILVHISLRYETIQTNIDSKYIEQRDFFCDIIKKECGQNLNMKQWQIFEEIQY